MRRVGVLATKDETSSALLDLGRIVFGCAYGSNLLKERASGRTGSVHGHLRAVAHGVLVSIRRESLTLPRARRSRA